MTKFFSEVSRRIAPEGLETEEQNGMLAVTMNGRTVCQVSAAGDVYLRSENIDSPVMNEAYDLTRSMADSAHEYVTALESAPLLKAMSVDIEDGYRRLCDYNGYVLAGMELPQNMGYQFVTWEYSYDRKGVGLGNYFMNDYEGAKEDFATRAELVSENKLFNKEQLHAIYEALDFKRGNDADLTFDHEDALIKIQRQIERAAPDIAFSPEPSASPGPHMNL
jgi:hypothetical protein